MNVSGGFDDYSSVCSAIFGVGAMNEAPSHAAILDSIQALSAKLDSHMKEVQPLVAIAPELKDWVDVMKAATVWRRMIIGLAALGIAVGTIAGLVLSLKFVLKTWLMG